MSEGFWLFAYGSLIWRPDFKYERRVRGFVEGFCRRFWQASTDHRGTPDQPGRVATLRREAGARCWGVAYQIGRDEAESVLRSLDEREQGGYQRVSLPFVCKDRTQPGALDVLAYWADETNPHYVGEAPLEDVATVVRSSRGPSGHNVEYVLRLADALSELGVEDEHVFELANLVSDPDGASE